MYKYGYLISYFFTKSHYTKMNMNWHVAYVYYNGTKPSIKFKFTEYTPLVDLNFILENLLEYSDNRRIVKLEYRSSSIDNERNIQFKTELKTDADLRVMWNTFNRYETKGLIELNVTIARSIEDIMKMLKRPSWCWNVLFDLC